MEKPENNIEDNGYFDVEIENDNSLSDVIPKDIVQEWASMQFIPFPEGFIDPIIADIGDLFVNPHTYTLPSSLHEGEYVYHGAIESKSVQNSFVLGDALNNIHINTLNVKNIYIPLRVIDLTSRTYIPENIWDKINQIISLGDLPSELYPMGISTCIDNDILCLCWMSFMKTRVPIFLVAEKDMPDEYSSISHPISQPRLEQKDCPREKKNDDKIQPDTIEYLGCYFPEKDVLGNKMPVIYLCPERIKAEADKYKNRKALFYIYAIVLIHEFAHAIMDETNHVHGNENKSFPSYYFNEKSRRYLEESLANMITLRYMEVASLFKHNKQYFRFTQEFIKGQADGYKWGNIMYEAKVDWTKWRNCKKNVKKNQDAINNWINKVAKPNPIAEEIKGLYNAIFEKTLKI